MASSKRPCKIPPEEGDFTVVQSKRTKWRLHQEDSTCTTEELRGSIPDWRLSVVSKDFTSRYQAIRWMEEECKLCLQVTVFCWRLHHLCLGLGPRQDPQGIHEGVTCWHCLGEKGTRDEGHPAGPPHSPHPEPYPWAPCHGQGRVMSVQHWLWTTTPHLKCLANSVGTPADVTGSRMLGVLCLLLICDGAYLVPLMSSVWPSPMPLLSKIRLTWSLQWKARHAGMSPLPSGGGERAHTALCQL